MAIHTQNETSDIKVPVHVSLHAYDMISQTLTIMYDVYILAQMTIYMYMYMFMMYLYQIWQFEFEGNDHTTDKMYLCRIP